MVTDEDMITDEAFLQFQINPPVSITSDNLPDGAEGEPYSHQLLAEGGTGMLLWSDLNGDLSGTGMALSSTGMLSGTPAVSGTISFTAAVTDAVGAGEAKPIQIIISAPYLCGDANNDEGVNLLDITYLINYLYKSGPEAVPPEAGDPDGGGSTNLLDVTYLINYLYKTGPEPLCP